MQQKLVLDNSLFYTLCLIVPTITIFHASFNDIFQPLLLIFRAIVLPFAAYLVIFRHGNPFLIYILSIYILIFGFGEFVYSNDKFLMNFIFLVSIVPMYRLGFISPDISNPVRLGRSLIYGSLILNIVIFSLFLLVFLGYVNLIDVYAIFDPARDAEKYGISRFSIGNAIEVPLLSSMLCYAGQRLMPISGLVIVALLLNLILAGISGSRIVILIAVTIMISSAVRANSKLLFSILFTLFIYFMVSYWTFIGDFIQNIVDRFYGDDGGSGSDRFKLFKLTYSSMSVYGFIFGEGLTSSMQMMFEETDTYRTIEAFGLEVLYELGILGLILFAANMIDGLSFKVITNTLSNIILLLAWLQTLFFLPLNPLLPITLFCIGVGTVKIDKNLEKSLS
tara:strand:- start:117 stop:1295 length:1179 start_codon:yes stop_codon:yes gene_type:complete